MARRTQVLLVDDLTGRTLPDGRGQTVRFSIDGTSYEIDLGKKNAEALRADFKRYTDVAHKVTPSRGRRRPTARRQDSSAIRAWARANGHEVNERGRIPSAVTEAFDAAQA